LRLLRLLSFWSTMAILGYLFALLLFAEMLWLPAIAGIVTGIYCFQALSSPHDMNGGMLGLAGVLALVAGGLGVWDLLTTSEVLLNELFLISGLVTIVGTSTLAYALYARPAGAYAEQRNSAAVSLLVAEDDDGEVSAYYVPA
jgi:hypothetical protein